MSDKEVVTASLIIQMCVNCPKCGYYIDLLDENDTNGTCHDDDSALLRQMFPANGDNDRFECEDVVCSECKHEFNVKALDW